LPEEDWASELDLLEAHFDMFQDWQEITNSIFCGDPAGLRQQMDIWF
jgi:hypothetical protein